MKAALRVSVMERMHWTVACLSVFRNDTHNNNDRFMALCPGLPVWASTRRNIHPLTYPDHHPIFISLFHLPQSIASSLFKLHASQSFAQPLSMSSLVYLLVWSPPPHLWSPYVIGKPYIFSSCFFLSSFFCSPNLSSRRLDVYHTSAHSVVLVWSWNVLRAARWKYRTQKSRKKSPSRHRRTTLSGHIFATKACIDNRKKTC